MFCRLTDTDAYPCHAGILSTGSCCIEDDTHMVRFSARFRTATVQRIWDVLQRFKHDSVSLTVTMTTTWDTNQWKSPVSLVCYCVCVSIRLVAVIFIRLHMYMLFYCKGVSLGGGDQSATALVSCFYKQENICNVRIDVSNHAVDLSFDFT